jgi:GAF domain-containing protein
MAEAATRPQPVDMCDVARALVAIVLADNSVESVLELLVALATTTMASADAASISIARAHSSETLTATSESCRVIDEVQYRTGQGPCVAAIRDGQRHSVAIVADSAQWPEFSIEAAGLGVRAMLATPLRAGGRIVGALNMYSMSHDEFGPVDVERAQEFADHIAVVLTNSDAFVAATELNVQMQDAMTTRSMIGQAQGLIMGRHACTANDAFARLRTTSQHTNRKLREVAQQMVDEAESAAHVATGGMS